MIVMYTEVHMTKEQSEKLKKWEKETGKDAEELAQVLVSKFIDELK